MKHFKLFILLLFFAAIKLSAQDLNWATAPYIAGSLYSDLGTVGATPSHVTLQITPSSAVAGEEPGFGPGSPAQYSAQTAAAPCGSTICALRSVVFFKPTPGGYVDYTFTFSPAVCGLNFNLLDIDGNTNPLDPGDLATIIATNSGIPQNVTLTSLDPGTQIITGSGTTSATVTGDNPNTIDERTRVNIASCITQLTIRYQCQGTDIGRSFSITNLTWPNAGPLPVKLLSFSGKKQSNTVQLKWLTENALDLHYFSVERSADGISYKPLGNINANAGLSSNAYTFTDGTPLTGTGFYRLRQVDVEGKSDYSSVVIIRSGNVKADVLSIFPNPANSYLFVSTGGNEAIQHLSIFNINGRLIVDRKNPTNRVDVSALPKGFYKIKIETTTGESLSGSFIK